MHNLRWFLLLALLGACSNTLRTTPAPLSTLSPQPTAPLIRPVTVQPPAAATVSPAVPTLAPSLAPTAAATTFFDLAVIPAATRGANAIVKDPGPICIRDVNARPMPEGALGSPQKPIVIALERYGDHATTAEAGAELAACLGEISGMTFSVVVGATPRETVDALASGQAQLAFLDELAILYGRQEHGFDTGLVILRTEGDGLKAYSRREIFANSASGIETMADVAGKTFCFGEPDNRLNTVIPWIILGANGVNPATDLTAVYTLRFADQIAMAVYRGECDAGSGYQNILTFPGEARQTYPDLADKVETFYVSEPIPNDGVQFASGSDAAIREATTDALLKMAADNPGKQRPLVTLYKIEGFMRAGNEFYDEFLSLVERAGVNLEQLIR